jgi:hypothetical protein
MRFVFTRRFRDRAIAVLVFVLVLPLLGGCSQLGIAKTDDLTAVETRLTNATRANSTRLDAVEKNTADMQKTLTELSTSIDTLNTRFLRAKAWLETMNLDTITKNADEASQMALAAEARSQEFFRVYLEWLKTMQTSLQEQIKLLESKTKEDPAETRKTPASTGDTGGTDSSTGGGG